MFLHAHFLNNLQVYHVYHFANATTNLALSNGISLAKETRRYLPSF